MRLIKLTMTSGTSVYLNVEMIGDIFEVSDKIEYGKTISGYTNVGHLTHNNGGFKIKETPKEILKLIEASRAL